MIELHFRPRDQCF